MAHPGGGVGLHAPPAAALLTLQAGRPCAGAGVAHPGGGVGLHAPPAALLTLQAGLP